MGADPDDAGGELLALALSRPNDAVARARAVLAAAPGPLDASVAHQAIGIVLREFGDIDAAVAELRTARRLAARGGSAPREADVLATLGVALVYAGRSRAGRNALDAAVRQSAGLLRGRALLRRGGCLLFLGLRGAALDDLNGAIGVLRAAGDQVWEARALTQRSQSHLAVGSVRRAAADLLRAESLYAECGQELESADAVMLRGVLAFRLGDLPEALARFDEAAGRHAALGVTDPDLTTYRCAALAAAGLAADAVREADAALRELTRVGGRPTKRADLLLTGADSALAAGDLPGALDRATEAGRLFGRHGQGWSRAHARLARVRAAARAGGFEPGPGGGHGPSGAHSPPTPALLRDARRCLRELADLGSPDLALARLAAGQIAVSLAEAAAAAAGPAQGSTERASTAEAIPAPARTAQASTADPGAVVAYRARLRGTARLLAEADGYLAAAAAGRHHGPALSRAAAWLAQARRAEAAGDARRLMRACRRGLTVLDEFRSVFGSSELRAQSTAHGAELAALGQRHATRLGRPRLMLEWSERWRAVALAVPPVRPPADEVLMADLAALRHVTGELTLARGSGGPLAPLEQERQRLERAVRARSLHAGGHGGLDGGLDGGGTRDGGPGPARERPFDVGALLDELGGERLLELVAVDGELHALVCGDGRVRRYPVGRTAEAARAVRFARQALRRAAHGPAVSPDDSVVLDWLATMGGQLDLALLGEAGRHLGDGSLVIVPPGQLQAVPWGLLPRLRSRAISVAPSAASWLRTRAASPAEGEDGAVVLVRGPGLPFAGGEVRRLAADYAAHAAPLGRASPVELGAGTATAERVLDALDGAALAHIAAHGAFRADSPLFSSLRLDDGPLTVYDLERLRRGPRRLVLSSCDSGVAAPAGADEVLGLASSLIPLGTAGIVASVVPVNDAAAVPLMIALHRELRAGASLAGALRDARLGLESDPVAAATGWSFICLGA